MEAIATITLVYLIATYLVCLTFLIKSRDFLNPVHIFLLSMVPPYVLFFFIRGTKLHEETYLLYILTITSFIMGYLYIAAIPKLCGRVSHIKKLDFDHRIQFNKLKPLLNMFLFIGLLGFMLGAIRAYQLSQLGPGDLLYNLRYAVIVLRLDIGFPKYMLLFLHIAVLFSIMSQDYRKWYIIPLIILWLTTSLFTMARTELLLALVSVFGAYSLSNKFVWEKRSFSLKQVIIFGSVFILGFVGMAIATKRIISALPSTITDYYIGSIMAFDTYALSFDHYSGGWNTFYPIAKLASGLGIAFNSQIQTPYVPPGQPNVFTMMAGPYFDYGIIGLFFVPFFLGLVYAIIYRRVRKGDIYFIAFYSLFLFPLILSFFAYQYSLASWLYYIAILILIKIWELLR